MGCRSLAAYWRWEKNQDGPRKAEERQGSGATETECRGCAPLEAVWSCHCAETQTFLINTAEIWKHVWKWWIEQLKVFLDFCYTITVQSKTQQFTHLVIKLKWRILKMTSPVCKSHHPTEKKGFHFSWSSVVRTKRKERKLLKKCVHFSVGRHKWMGILLIPKVDVLKKLF